jgi:hypothetical protein
MEDLKSLVYKFGSQQLKNIVENLDNESAVTEGRTVIDYKLYDRIVINDGLDRIDDSNNGFKVYGKIGQFLMPQLTQFFNKTADGRTLQALQLTNNTPRINNLVLDGKADEPFRFDRLAVDIEVYQVRGRYNEQGEIQDGQDDPYSEQAMAVAKQILMSGKLIVNVNGRDLNYAEPLGFAGSSVALDGTRITNIYNKKTPKFIDPAIFLPESTSFNAKIEMIEPVYIPADVSVAITVSLLGYKFLKNC